MSDLIHLEVISNESFHSFVKLIHQLTGIKIDDNRKQMLIGRLRRRVIALNLSSYEDYFRFISIDSHEKEIFIENITTNETYCYRTPRIWRYLIENYIPKWIQENQGKTLHAWSAAASSGEEAHTLGAVLQSFRDQRASFQYQILGTDISRKMIHKSNEGQYQGRAIDRFKQEQPALFSRYFQKREDQYSVVPEIKQRLAFKQHNLFHSLNHPNLFDIVLLRNVLIYFNPEDQEKVLDIINKKMSPNAILIIGESESLSNIRTNFSFVDTLIYRHKTHVNN